MNKLSQLLENLATQCQLEKGKPERSEGKEVEAASEKLKDYVSSKSRISSNITASKTEQDAHSRSYSSHPPPVLFSSK